MKMNRNLQQQLALFTVCVNIILIKYVGEGFTIEPRIISGKPVKDGQYPWQVALKKSRYGELHGGASIISADWVLTAAHCTYGLKSVYLIFGTRSLWDFWALGMTSRDIHIHPKYDDFDLKNDISLIKLPTSLTFSLSIQPIPLVSYRDRNTDFVGKKAYITGFGYISDNIPNLFGDLLHAEVIIISNRECNNFYEGKVFNSTICSKGINRSNNAICNGDSGGPLITRNKAGDFIQIGIISYSAKASCRNGHPSAYARITAFLAYIKETTNLNLN